MPNILAGCPTGWKTPQPVLTETTKTTFCSWRRILSRSLRTFFIKVNVLSLTCGWSCCSMWLPVFLWQQKLFSKKVMCDGPNIQLNCVLLNTSTDLLSMLEHTEWLRPLVVSLYTTVTRPTAFLVFITILNHVNDIWVRGIGILRTRDAVFALLKTWDCPLRRTSCVGLRGKYFLSYKS